eukprot:366516-Chlamydomonas_euryale.AAC.11
MLLWAPVSCLTCRIAMLSRASSGLGTLQGCAGLMPGYSCVTGVARNVEFASTPRFMQQETFPPAVGLEPSVIRRTPGHSLSLASIASALPLGAQPWLRLCAAVQTA